MGNWFTGTDDKLIYADAGKSTAGISEFTQENLPFLQRMFGNLTGGINASRSGAGVFQGRAPALGAQAMFPYWENLHGIEARKQNPVGIKQGNAGFLGSLISAAGSAYAGGLFGGGGPSTSTGAGLQGNDLSGWQKPGQQYTGPFSGPDYY